MSQRKERDDIRFTVGIIDHPPESGSHAQRSHDHEGWYGIWMWR
jgi:hypothetical protein